MNLRFSTLASALVSSSAWAPTTHYQLSTAESKAFHLSPTAPLTRRSLSSIPLRSTVTPQEDITTPASIPDGKPIADGCVVSSFKGGLIAVRVEDDIMETLTKSPKIIDGTNSFPVPSKQSNLGGDLIGRQVVFDQGQTGLVVAHRPPMAFVYTGSNDVNHDIEGGAKVLDSLASVDVHETRKFVDCFGRSLVTDDEEDHHRNGDNSRRAIFAPIPKVSDIALINSPLVTGVTMFDALAPIGKGQNMLLIGHDIKDMRQYVCDLVSIQRQSTKCVYASTTENQETVEMLTKAGVMDDLVLVSARNMDGMDKASIAAEATVTAATACSIAESFALDKGMDTLVIIDTIDHHKSLWDTTTRVLVDVFGVDAVVKGEREGAASSEMRAFFSSLVQRSAQYNQKKGGGSVTLLLLITIPKMADTDGEMEFSPDEFAGAPKKVKDRIDLLVQRKVPLTEATLRKIQIPVPSDAEGFRRMALQHVDDLISMSDGQIWLDEELERNGRRPAMDFQRSVTRIGIGADTESRADAPAMRRVVEGLRLDLSQAVDMAGADVGTNASKNQARNALAWLLAMHQPSSRGPRKLSESCVAMLAASKGYLGESVDKGAVAGSSAGDEIMSNLLDHVSRTASEAMYAIDQTNDLTKENQQAIEKSIQSFFS